MCTVIAYQISKKICMYVLNSENGYLIFIIYTMLDYEPILNAVIRFVMIFPQLY